MSTHSCLETGVAKFGGCRERRVWDTPTIDDQVPELLESLADALKRANDRAKKETDNISAEHGLLRWQVGFDVTEVVAEYNILRGCLQDLAERHGIILSGEMLHIVNSVFDEAIGRAIKAFETMMTIELQHRHEEHIAFLLHDLRTPLEALSLATTLLDRSMREDGRNSTVRSALAVMRGNIDRLAERVRYVLSSVAGLGRHFQPEFTWVRLHDLVREMIRDLGPLAASAGTEVHNDVPADLEIYSDAKLVSQIIQNLMSNALKFTPQGSVQVRVCTVNVIKEFCSVMEYLCSQVIPFFSPNDGSGYIGWHRVMSRILQTTCCPQWSAYVSVEAGAKEFCLPAKLDRIGQPVSPPFLAKLQTGPFPSPEELMKKFLLAENV